MKKLNLTLAVIVAGTALLHTTASAAVGDLILGFQTASPNMGNATNLELDLGAASTYIAAEGTGATFNLSSDLNLSDLNAIYGSSPTALFFGVNGTTGSSTTNELFISSTDGTDPKNSAGTAGNNERSKLSTVYGAYGAGVAGAAGSTDESVSTGVTGSYTNVAGALGTYGNYFPFDTQALYSNSGTETLALYDDVKGSGNATEVGTLSLTSNGTTESLVLNSTGAVPEPSTYALMGVGALAVLALRRRSLLQS